MESEAALQSLPEQDPAATASSSDGGASASATPANDQIATPEGTAARGELFQGLYDQPRTETDAELQGCEGADRITNTAPEKGLLGKLGDLILGELPGVEVSGPSGSVTLRHGESAPFNFNDGDRLNTLRDGTAQVTTCEGGTQNFGQNTLVAPLTPTTRLTEPKATAADTTVSGDVNALLRTLGGQRQ